MDRAPDGVRAVFPTIRGMIYHLQSSPNLTTWETVHSRYGVGGGETAAVIVYTPPPTPATPPSSYVAPAFYHSLFLCPISTQYTVVSWFRAGGFHRALLTGADFKSGTGLSGSFRMKAGTLNDPTDDTVLDCTFLGVGWTRDFLLLPRQDEGFPSVEPVDRVMLQKLIDSRVDIINARNNSASVSAGPPPATGARRYYRLLREEPDTDGDGVSDATEFAASGSSTTAPFQNPALNPPGTTTTTPGSNGLKWRPFWQRGLPAVTIQQTWRKANVQIAEYNPSTGDEVRRGGTKHKQSSTTGVNVADDPLLTLTQIRGSIRPQIVNAWSTGPAVTLDDTHSSAWKTWLPTDGVPIRSRAACKQGETLSLFDDAKWTWALEGEERCIRLTCDTNPPEDIQRHFLRVCRSKMWLKSQPEPGWTYDEPTEVITLTIRANSPLVGGKYVSEIRKLEMPAAFNEADSPSLYTAKAAATEEILLPVEVIVPQRNASGVMLGLSGGVRPQVYAPELRIAKLHPGLDSAGIEYQTSAVTGSGDNAKYALNFPEQDPDSFMIRIHDLSEVWRGLAPPGPNPRDPRLRLTTWSQMGLTQTGLEASRSDTAATGLMNSLSLNSPNNNAPGWFSTKALILTSRPSDDEEKRIDNVPDDAPEDRSRIVLPGGTSGAVDRSRIIVGFGDWQLKGTTVPTITVPVPAAAVATVDLRNCPDSGLRTEVGEETVLLNSLNDFYGSVGVRFKRSATGSPPLVPLAPYPNSVIPNPDKPYDSTFLWNDKIIRLLKNAGRSTVDGNLGVLFAKSNSAVVLGGIALADFRVTPTQAGHSGNVFLFKNNFTFNDPFNLRVAAHEIGHILTNAGHFKKNYAENVSALWQNWNLMSEEAYLLNLQQFDRFAELQETLILGSPYLKNP